MRSVRGQQRQLIHSPAIYEMRCGPIMIFVFSTNLLRQSKIRACSKKFDVRTNKETVDEKDGKKKKYPHITEGFWTLESFQRRQPRQKNDKSRSNNARTRLDTRHFV